MDVSSWRFIPWYHTLSRSQLNNSSPEDPIAPTQYTSNNKDAFKYREITEASFLPVLAVISPARDNSPCSVLSCVCVCVWCGAGGQCNLSPQISSDNRMLLRIHSRKLQHTRKSDVIAAQIRGNAKCVCHRASMFALHQRYGRFTRRLCQFYWCPCR